MLAHLFLLYTNYFIATTHLKYYQKYLFIYRPFFFFKELFIFRLNVCFMFLIFFGGSHGLLLLLCLNGLSLLNSFLIHWRPIRIWATCRVAFGTLGLGLLLWMIRLILVLSISSIELVLVVTLIK